MTKLNYNPDVLSCLANLSNDEVFTPPQLANQMLNMLPQELFQSPDTKFLDPCSKSGVFLREIAKRLLDGLATKIPDLQERIDHIMHYQLYGMAITQLTSLMSRRSLYCSKDASGKYSLSHFDNADGNIRYNDIQHSWQNGKCRYCGASQEVYDRGDGLESHAYEFIHTDNPNELYNNMTFDVIIGNPPYQLSDGGGASDDTAMPIYNRFIEQAIKLNPHYLSMIIPSKWMVGGRGLSKFREKMRNDTRISKIVDFEDSSKCFTGLHIDGGISYFLWDSNYNGMTEYTFHANDGTINQANHYLTNTFSDYVIRDNRIFSILKKTSVDESFSMIISNVRPYGIRGYLFNEPERYPNSNLQETPFKGCVKIYGVRGIKGGAKRVVGFINSDIITANREWINKYKIFFTTSYSTNAVIPPAEILSQPKEVCTETFLSIGPFESKTERDNCASYLHTNLFRFLLYYGKGTMHVNKTVFSLIPLQDFSKPWTDEELYKKYGLSEDEIQFIESMIRPME